ncbi:hypothetical protein EQG79_01045 [Spirosoma sordidisoli]|uniref:Uncharacterized protein n=1 Tax=Spirosoma sordidisoli TaxID=2502893 RepID=A0A4Q2UV27_9BACT|nr:hypothetical protein EQG79_01045 [Spirosoma sordidisoli]
MDELFDNYLLKKKIDANRFREQEPDRYVIWAREYAQMHPDSFTAQKKFLLNDTRRKYLVR